MKDINIRSRCVAMSTYAISFDVIVDDFADNVYAKGNVLVNAEYKCDAHLTFLVHPSDKDSLNDDILEHCINRAKIVFLK